MKEETGDAIFTIFMIIFGIVVLAMIYIGGYVDGTRNEHESWVEFATENGWAHYDAQTGSVILHDLEYQQKVLDDILNFEIPDKGDDLL